MASTIGIVLLGTLIPFTPVAGPLGFTPLPWSYFAFLVPAGGTYLALVELAKRRLSTRMLSEQVAMGGDVKPLNVSRS